MGLFDFLKPKKRTSDLDSFEKRKRLYELMNAKCLDGCDTDEIPDGHGEFGHEVTNPIPTNTIQGSKDYLARLCAPDGAKVVYRRLGSCFNAEVSPHPIDAYAITHPDGTSLGTLYVSPYHKRNSKKAPKGFTLLKDLFAK